MPHDVDALNAGFAGQLLEQYLENPSSVPEEWRALFERGDDADVLALQPGLVRLLEQRTQRRSRRPSDDSVTRPGRGRRRRSTRSCSAASPRRWRSSRRIACTAISPRGSTRSAPSRPATRRSSRSGWIPKLTPELQARIPARLLRTYVDGETLAEALPKLQETYCGTIAYEIEHISDHEERVWLREAIESGRYRQPLERRRGARAAHAADARSRGSRRTCASAFLGQKQFSIEGLDVLVPMLDESIELAADAGAHEVVIGMAHRGRLNVLAHVDRPAVRDDPARVRGRADDRGGQSPTPRAAPAT